VGFIQVFRNGVLLGSADYTASNGTTVVLAVGATAGDLVTVVGFYVSSVLNAIPATTGSVSSTYIAAGAVGATQIAAGAVGTTQLAAGAVAQVDLAAGVAGNGPLFRVTPSTTQTISHNTVTKVNWGTEVYDTNSNFATNAFTPTVAGYYQFTANVELNNTNGSSYYTTLYFYKNGVSFSNLDWGYSGNAGGRSTVGYSDLISMNGTTDYVEVYVYNYDYTGLTSVSVRANSIFSGAMVRSA
jgi:hypothetical protein